MTAATAAYACLQSAGVRKGFTASRRASPCDCEQRTEQSQKTTNMYQTIFEHASDAWGFTAHKLANPNTNGSKNAVLCTDLRVNEQRCDELEPRRDLPYNQRK